MNGKVYNSTRFNNVMRNKASMLVINSGDVVGEENYSIVGYRMIL